HTRFSRDWSSDVCSSDLNAARAGKEKSGDPRGHRSCSYANTTRPASILRIAHRPDQRLHVADVLIECAATGLGQAVLGSRHAPVEGLGARDVRRILELACVHAQVAVRRVEERLQLVEREGLVDGEGTDDAQPDALVNRPVKLERTGKRLS